MSSTIPNQNQNDNGAGNNNGETPANTTVAVCDERTPREHNDYEARIARNTPTADGTAEIILLYAVHFDEVAAAIAALPDLFTGVGERSYNFVWQELKMLRAETGKLPDYEHIQWRLEQRIANERQNMPAVAQVQYDAVMSNVTDVLRWIYLQPANGYQAVRPTSARCGFEALRKFGMRRLVDEPWAAILAERGHPRRDELKQRYDELAAKIDEVCQATEDTDVSLEALVSGTYTHNWLIKNALVEGAPMIVGGPKKALKTSILLDLAVSLGIGEGVRFLNDPRFQVEKRVAVGMYSGESNAPTVATTVRNILASKNRRPGEAVVHFQFATPKLIADGDLAAIQAFIRKRNLGVIIFDPAYTSLLKGNSKASASNVFDMGEVLSKITEACLAAGATPIFAHHTVKHAGKKPGRNGTLYQSYEPAELGDLAFAGFAEFARQWLLIARRADYEPGTGRHSLWVTTGGSAGFNGCYSVDIDEGVMGEDFRGKKWEVRVQTQAEAGHNRVSEKQQAATIKEQEDRQRVLDALRDHGGHDGITINSLVHHARMGRPTIERHLAALSALRSAEVCGSHKGGAKWRSVCPDQ